MTNFIIKYRWLIITVSIVSGLIMAALIPLSVTDPEIRNYVPQNMDSRIATNKIEDEFGVQDMVMILFRDSTILTQENLKQIKAIDRDISRLSGVSQRMSPFTVKTIKSEENSMVADPLLKRIPEDKEGLERLGEEILNNRFARDIVFSSDLTSAAITATINNSQSEKSTLNKIDSITGVHSEGMEVFRGGLPYIRQNIMKDVRKDGIILVPFALGLMLLILKLTLGEWKSVFMPFSVVILSTGICMGLIPLMGWKLSVITLLAPIILVAVANNYGIYLVARYQELRLDGKERNPEATIRELLGSLNMPILFSGLTTIAGILGLVLHSIIPARQGGILAATGVTAALLMSLAYIPALIYLQGRKSVNFRLVKANSKFFNKVLRGLSGFIIRHPGRIIAGSIGLTIIFLSGIFLIRIETNQENFFPKNNPVRLASSLINEKFGGSQTMSVMISGNIKDPDVMKGIDRITLETGKIKGVGEVFSISTAVREMSKAIYTEGEPGYDNIPEKSESIAQMFELYNMSGNPDDFSQMMNLENSRAHILIRLSQPDNSVIKTVKARIRELTADFPAEVTSGGYAMIMTDFAASIIKGQVLSLIFALATVLILLAIIFRSFRGGLIGSIPLAISIVILFGFMGFAGIELDAATALLSSIMIGVGVDFTIQYLWCFNIQLRNGLGFEDASKTTMETIGRSIIINAVSVMAGFTPLMFSGFTSIKFFGYLVFISIGSCLLGALILIPAIIIKYRPRFIERNLKKSIIKSSENEKSPVNIGTAAYVAVGAASRGRPDNEQIS